MIAIALIRTERENLNCLTSNTISMTALKNPLLCSTEEEEKSFLSNDTVRETGIRSMNLPFVLQPVITQETEKSSIEKVINKTIIEVDSVTYTATIHFKEDEQTETPFYKCCF